MSGETSLSKLLQGMQPILSPGEYVFCCIGDRDNHYSQLNPLGQRDPAVRRRGFL